ncbi:MAG: thioredoxin family protein [Candidatus Peribacteraceae bacterium]
MVLINDNSSALKIGDMLPSFSLPATDDTTVSADKLLGIRVIVFTCNHCPYAKAVEPRLIAIAQEFTGKASMVLISSNDAEAYPEDSFDEMKRRAEERRYPFPYCFDEDQSVAKRFGALCTPHCFVFDAAGALQYKGRVDDNWQDETRVKDHTLRDAIAALVEANKPKTPEANALGCSIKWRT